MTDWDYERKMNQPNERSDEEMKVLHQMMDSIDHMPSYTTTNTLVFYLVAVLASYGIEGEEAGDVLAHAARAAPEIHAVTESSDAISRLMSNSKH